MKRILFAIIVLATAQVVSSLAQTPDMKTLNGGVLNGKAISLPKPVYPDEAKIAKLGGNVSVQVTIDEGGNVISVARRSKTQSSDTVDREKAEALRLRSLLEDAAEQAAWQAKFTPTLLSGNPVKVTGIIVYSFVPPGSEVKEQPGTGSGFGSGSGLGSGSGGGIGSISGGVLNGKAVSLPTPAYPAAAKAVKAAGTVVVKVLVDETGEVISAAAASGHPLLQAAAVEAARSAKFAPTLLQGKPVKISGIITYNFVADTPEN
jgi:TonB family protein